MSVTPSNKEVMSFSLYKTDYSIVKYLKSKYGYQDWCFSYCKAFYLEKKVGAKAKHPYSMKGYRKFKSKLYLIPVVFAYLLMLDYFFPIFL